MAIPVSFNPPQTQPADDKFRLHLGGWEPKPGWKILNIQKRDGVDFVGNCMDLSQFAAASVDEIYASHVYEHLDYQKELRAALAEAARVLKPGGIIRIGVPDLEVLCRLFLDQRLPLDQRFHVMRMMYGGQTDEYDFHYVGLSFEILALYLNQTGFKMIRRVREFGIFHDTTTLQFAGQMISLNVEAVRA
jgi:predicted SAM-dependent methyltransferase